MAVDRSQNSDHRTVPDGLEVIRRAVKTLPRRPGVYRMCGVNNDLLYVGKAKNLKARVSSYTRLTGHTTRIARMISLTRSMEFVTTESETEALLLEANLIKRLKPRFNVIMRDDRSFPSILLSGDHEAPQILKHRGARKRKGDYYGPFASAGSVNRTLNALQKAFLLRSCSDSVYHSRTRPCLLYQIKRCAAPCTGKINLEDYGALVEQGKLFLAGKSQTIQKQLVRLMERASETLDYEQAAIYRDRIAALTQIQSSQNINPKTFSQADVFGVFQESGQTCIQVFFFRTGQNWGNRAYYPRHDKSQDCAEVLEAFVAQFYDNKPAPKLILLNQKIKNRSLLAEALSLRMDHKVTVTVPQRGEKRRLISHVYDNARDALKRKLADSTSQQNLLKGVTQAFNLPAPPQRIEVYDNSHIQGSHPIGAMIVAGADGFLKNQYRKFNIRSNTIKPGDDYGMMREVLTRRFSRLIKTHGPRPLNAGEEGATVIWPDLLLIDGGQGQLNVAHEVLSDLGVGDDIVLVGIAKGKQRNAGQERFFMIGRKPFTLEANSAVLYFVQRLRDEAHRFALGGHRARRKKAMTANPLDDIAGIGGKRKKALLTHFGSAKAVARANVTDLATVDGISQKTAQMVYDFFNEPNELTR